MRLAAPGRGDPDTSPAVRRAGIGLPKAVRKQGMGGIAQVKTSF